MMGTRTAMNKLNPITTLPVSSAHGFNTLSYLDNDHQEARTGLPDAGHNTEREYRESTPYSKQHSHCTNNRFIENMYK